MSLDNAYNALFAAQQVDPYKESLNLRTLQDSVRDSTNLRSSSQTFENQVNQQGFISPLEYQRALVQNPNKIEQIKSMFGSVDIAGQNNLATQAIRTINLLNNGSDKDAATYLSNLAAADTNPQGRVILSNMAAAILKGDKANVISQLTQSLGYNPSPLAVQYTNNVIAQKAAEFAARKTVAETGKLNAETINLGSPSQLLTAMGLIRSGKINEAVKVIGTMPIVPEPVTTVLSNPGFTPEELISSIQSSMSSTETGRKILESLNKNRENEISIRQESGVTGALRDRRLNDLLNRYPNDPRLLTLEKDLVRNANKIVTANLTDIAIADANNDTARLQAIFKDFPQITQNDADLVAGATSGKTHSERFNAIKALVERVGAVPVNPLGKSSAADVTEREENEKKLREFFKKAPKIIAYLKTNPEGYSSSETWNTTVRGKQRILGSNTIDEETRALIGLVSFGATTDAAKILKPMTDADIETARRAVNLENKSADYYIKHLRNIIANGIIEKEITSLRINWENVNGNTGPNLNLMNTTLLGRNYDIPYGLSYKQFVDQLVLKNGDFQTDTAKEMDKIFKDNEATKGLAKSRANTPPQANTPPVSYKDPYYQHVNTWAEERLGLPAGMLHSIMYNGERTNSNVESVSHAKTVYQVIPSTRDGILKKTGYDAYSTDPREAALAAGSILKENLERTGWNIDQAIRQYLLGPNPNMNHNTVRQMANIADEYVDRVRKGMIKVGAGVQTPAPPVNDPAPQFSPPPITPIPPLTPPPPITPITPASPITPTSTIPPLTPPPPITPTSPIKEIGWPDRAMDLITGKERETPMSIAAKDFYDLPELSFKKVSDPDTTRALLATWHTDPEETAKIIEHIFPGITSGKDEKGNIYFKRPGDENRYMIKPGMQISDVVKAGLTAAVFTAAAGGATALAPTMPLIAAAGATAGLSGAEQMGQRAAGGSFDVLPVAIDTATVFLPGGVKAKKKVDTSVPGTPNWSNQAVTDVLGEGNVARQAELLQGTAAEKEAAARVLTAQEELGIQSVYPPSLVGSEKGKAVAGVVTSGAIRQAGAQKDLYIKEITDKIEQELLSASGGLTHGDINTATLNLANQTLAERHGTTKRIWKIMEGLSETGENIAIEGGKFVRRDKQVGDLSEIQRILNKRKADLGGHLQPVDKIIEEMLAGKNGQKVTVGLLREIKNKIYDKSIFPDLSSSARDGYAQAIRITEENLYKDAGLGTQYGNAKKSTIIEKQMQESMKSLWGQNLDSTLIPKVRVVTGQAIRDGHHEALSELMEDIGRTTLNQGAGRTATEEAIKASAIARQHVLSVALDSVLKTGRKGEEISLSHFVRTYGPLLRKKVDGTIPADLIGPPLSEIASPLRSIFEQHLGSKRMEVMDNFYYLAKNLVEAESHQYRTGVQTAIEDVVKRQDNVANKVKRMFAYGGVGGVIDTLLGSAGLPGGATALGSILSFTIKSSRTNAIEALDNIFSNPALMTALKDQIRGVEQKPEVIRAIFRSKKMQDAISVLQKAAVAVESGIHAQPKPPLTDEETPAVGDIYPQSAVPLPSLTRPNINI